MKKIFILFLLALLPIGMAAYTLGRVSVHDPSIVWDQNSRSYYIFGSHRGAAKTTDLMNWTAFTAPWGTTSSNNAANTEAFTTSQVTSVTIGRESKNFGPFNAYAYSAAIATSSIDGNSWGSIDGNMWAPDVIWNPNMSKWCMYLSLNGIQWNSSVILLTADNIEGPYTYQGPIVFSGFNVTDNEATSYKKTDLELVLGEQTSLPDRYNKGNSWGTYWPHCIDPCVFFDADNNLWLTYGSWSGGIYILRLNKNTGLRDYDYTYKLSYSDNSKEETVLSDPYFGKKIAGGCYVSGEASYIERIGNYYYLFMSYGFYDSVGGYQMRVFRSSNPDGPYTDPQNGEGAAIFSSYRMNYGSTANTSRGEYIFGAYGDWGNVAKGATSERSQGHNSIIAADDGRTYLVYHTKFQNWGESHQVRVHQVFQNEDGWLVAAPFEYTGETVTSADIASTRQIATDDIPGLYKLLVHRDKLNHTIKEMVTPVEIELKSDKTITGEYTGSWALPEGTNSYINITLGSTTYKGVIIEQTMEPGNDKVIAFTAMSSSNGINIWGHKYTPVVDEPITSGYNITTGLQAYYNFDASPIANSENNEQVATLQQEGTNTVPVLQTDAERTGKVLHTMFGAGGNTSNAKFANPLYNQILDVGATLAFWVNPIEVNFWDALFGFQNSEGGRLYMTGNNYVGYNSGGWIDLNHPNSVTTGDITFGHWNFVTVTFSRTEGPKVYVDGVHKPFQTNGNGDANLDYNDMMVNFIQSCPDFYFGYGSWWGSANALFDELLFYNRVLTETDIKALYQKETEDGKFKEVAVDPNYIPEPVYFNDFSSATGVEIVGNGAFEEDADSHFGQVFHNDTENTSAVRTNYLKLPTDILSHSATSKEMTIGFWVNKKSENDYFYTPLFAAYGAAPNAGVNTWPMFVCETRGLIQLNCAGYCDFGINDSSPGTTYNDGTPYVNTTWLDDAKWHYYTVALTATTAKVYIDGELKNGWTVDGTSDGQVISGLFTGGSNLTYVTLGGNQAWNWNDADPAFAFDDFAVYDVALTPEQIAQIITDKSSGVTPTLTYDYTVMASYGGKTKTISSGTGEKDASITVVYPRYILDGTKLYEAAATSNNYSKTFTLSSENQEETVAYSASTTSNVYYYAEAEDVLSGATSDLPAASNGKLGGRQKSSSNYTELVTLPAGTWQISTAVYVGNSGEHTVNFKVGDEVKWTFTKGATSGWYNATSENIVLTKAATVSVAVDGGSTTGIDWIYIKSANNFEVVGATDYTSVYRSANSPDYTIKKGDTKVFTFKNYGKYPGESYNNWVMVVREDGDDKSVTRADFYDVTLGKHLDNDGNDSSDDWVLMSTDGGNTRVGVNWDKFKEDMADALVEATVTYGVDGNLAINAVATGAANGYKYYVDNVGHITGTGNMTINLSVDQSWLEIISVEQTAVGVTTTAAGMGFATLYTDLGLDFSGTTGLTAYTATLDGETVTLTQVNDIQAGTGVVLKSEDGSQNITYSLPVINSSSTVKGDLQGNATESTACNAFDGYTLYMLAINQSNEAQFTKVTDGSIAAGKAYLKVPTSADTRAFIVSFGDDATGIRAIESAENGDRQIYTLSGQRVTKPGKGLYIVNGKKVIIK